MKCLCPSAAGTQTASGQQLHERAATLRDEGVDAGQDPVSFSFPMYTLPLTTFLLMTEAPPHEELFESNRLVEFEPVLGRAMFISHQWLGNAHPDPQFEQMRILQQALRNLLSGRCRVSVSVTTELYLGRVRGYSTAALNEKPLFLWCDYFSCPQTCSNVASSCPKKSKCKAACDKLQKAIDSIPAYVAQCEFFVILCPTVTHADNGTVLNKFTWAQRGWCRAERMARELSTSNNGMMIVIESPKHITLQAAHESITDSPGKGSFSIKKDLERVGNIVHKLVKTKLRHSLVSHDFHNYRFLLNQQGTRFKGLPSDSVRDPDLRPPGVSSPSTDMASFVVETFFYENGFSKVTERDSNGWSPLCYAALNGNPVLVAALLEKGADPNDRIRKAKPEASMPKNMSVLKICAAFTHNEALKRLLVARANVNAAWDLPGATALHYASIVNNVAGIRLLTEFGACRQAKLFPGLSPLACACSENAADAVAEYLADQEAPRLKNVLHITMMFQKGTTRVVSSLLRARADINEQFVTDPRRARWWALFTYMRVKHSWSSSTLSAVAYHHNGSTPLMLSIVCGLFDVAAFLVANGAKIDIKNFRQKTALDLAREMLAPESLVEALEGVH